MKRAEATIVAAFALWLTGCALRGKQQAARIPPPQPAPPPSAPAPPLSTPQTQVQLPPPQPIDPAALAAAEAPQEPAPAAPPVATQAPSKPAAAPPLQPKAEPATPAAQIAPPERPRIEEIVPAEEQKHLQDSRESRKKEIQQLLRQAQARRLNSQERTLVNHIQSFVKASDAAAARGDLRQADALAESAQILARDLQNGK